MLTWKGCALYRCGAESSRNVIPSGSTVPFRPVPCLLLSIFPVRHWENRVRVSRWNCRVASSSFYPSQGWLCVFWFRVAGLRVDGRTLIRGWRLDPFITVRPLPWRLLCLVFMCALQHFLNECFPGTFRSLPIKKKNYLSLYLKGVSRRSCIFLSFHLLRKPLFLHHFQVTFALGVKFQVQRLFSPARGRRRPIVSALPRCQRAVCRRPCLRSSLCDVSAPRPAPRPWLLSGMFSFSFIFCMLNMICLAMCLGGYLLCLIFSGLLGSAIWCL